MSRRTPLISAALTALTLVLTTIISEPAVAGRSEPTRLAGTPALKATPSAPITGEVIRFTGTLGSSAARPIKLQRLSGSTWLTTNTGTSSSTGTFSILGRAVAAAGSSSRFRVLAPRVTISGTVRPTVTTPSKVLWSVGQSATLTPAKTLVLANQKLSVTARFKPVRAGRPVAIQRKIGSTWTKVASGVQNSYGGVVVTVPSPAPGTHQFRAVTSAAAGAPAATSAAKSVQFSAASAWTQLSVGRLGSCGIKVGGSLWCWGNNFYGQQGTSTGTGVDEANPTPVKIAGTWTSVASGQVHNCGLRSDSTVWCWGFNWYGQLGNSSDLESEEAHPTPTQVAGVWRSLTVGNHHTCAIRSDDSAWCWGRNVFGQLGSATNSGTDEPTPTPTQVPGSWTSLQAGERHTCGVKTSGAGFCWGLNEYGQLALAANSGTANPNPTPTQIVADAARIDGGGNHSCWRKTDGSSACWGRNTAGELGSTVNNGTSTPNHGPITLAGSWVSFALGEIHSCGLQAGGVAFCWGSNYYGQLGNTTNSTSSTANPTPTQVAGNWTWLATGGDTTCGIKSNGTAWCWGDNYWGQAGNSTNNEVNDAANPTPTLLIG